MYTYANAIKAIKTQGCSKKCQTHSSIKWGTNPHETTTLIWCAWRTANDIFWWIPISIRIQQNMFRVPLCSLCVCCPAGEAHCFELFLKHWRQRIFSSHLLVEFVGLGQAWDNNVYPCHVCVRMRELQPLTRNILMTTKQVRLCKDWSWGCRIVCPRCMRVCIEQKQGAARYTP